MNDKDREVLATVSKLNRDTGAIVLALLSSEIHGRPAPTKLRELAAIYDDMSALLDNHADEVTRNLTVIDGGLATRRALASDQGEDALIRLTHRRVIGYRSLARRCAQEGGYGVISMPMLEAAQNLTVVAAALEAECGCPQCLLATSAARN